MEEVRLDLGEKAYTISIGAGLLRAGLLAPLVTGDQALVVTTESIAPHYLAAVQESLASVSQVDWMILKDGESTKTTKTFEAVITLLLEKGHRRATTLIALGGGVVGDITGFVAATYQRGVPFVQIPTTLLSQVDSSVGGKTGVNHPLGKNMIGAFYQPKGVIVDIETLSTLPSRELVAGMAEVIKHGMLADGSFFEWLETHISDMRNLDPDAMAYAIRRNVEIKADVVARDEKETGVRATLNLGHTFGHAIESGLGYGQWVHGEAVGAGLVMAADLSARLGRIGLREAGRVRRLVAAAGLPELPPQTLDADQMLDLMARDKKASATGLRFVLLDAIGAASIADDVPKDVLRATLLAREALCT